jgi:hypothetical protein
MTAAQITGEARTARPDSGFLEAWQNSWTGGVPSWLVRAGLDGGWGRDDDGRWHVRRNGVTSIAKIGDWLFWRGKGEVEVCTGEEAAERLAAGLHAARQHQGELVRELAREMERVVDLERRIVELHEVNRREIERRRAADQEIERIKRVAGGHDGV